MSRARGTDRPWRIPRTGLIAAVVTFLMLGSTGVAYAYWSASSTLTSTASAGSIAVSLSNFSSMQKTFANNALTHTGSLTVSNTSTTTSTAQLPVSIGLGIASGSNDLASNLGVIVWGPVAASSCTAAATPSGTVKTGTWASFSALATTLSKGQSSSWCVRTATDERSKLASAGGTLDIAPKATVTLTAGTWTATATANSAQSTQYIFNAHTPLSSSWFNVVTASGACLEVAASGGSGSALVRTSCAAAPNQAFKISGAGGNSYLTLTPKHNENLRWGDGGSSITAQTATLAASQAWQLQTVSGVLYQIVNKNSGLCAVSSAAAPSPTTQAPCDGTANQRFSLSAVTFSMNLVCTNTGNNGAHGRVTYSWSVGAAGVYTVQADRDTSAGVNWQTLGTSGANATSVAIDGTLPISDPITGWANATYDVRVLDSGGSVVATSAILVRNSGGFECG